MEGKLVVVLLLILFAGEGRSQQIQQAPQWKFELDSDFGSERLKDQRDSHTGWHLGFHSVGLYELFESETHELGFKPYQFLIDFEFTDFQHVNLVDIKTSVLSIFFRNRESLFLYDAELTLFEAGKSILSDSAKVSEITGPQVTGKVGVSARRVRAMIVGKVMMARRTRLTLDDMITSMNQSLVAVSRNKLGISKGAELSISDVFEMAYEQQTHNFSGSAVSLKSRELNFSLDLSRIIKPLDPHQIQLLAAWSREEIYSQPNLNSPLSNAREVSSRLFLGIGWQLGSGHHDP